MKVFVQLSDLSSFPSKHHEDDVGLDVIASSEPTIVGESKTIKKVDFYSNIDYIEYETELKFAPQNPYYALIYPRSSVSKQNLFLANSVGVVDPGYRNTVKVRFKYVFQPEDLVFENGKIYGKVNKDKIYSKGDKICQLIWANENSPITEYVEKLPPSDRGLGGFGSTGR
jgi:dUTP pyrophosphatase